MISINLEEAFDTVNHHILIKKMDFIEFSEETAKWFQSYLSNRKLVLGIRNKEIKISVCFGTGL